MAFGEEASGVLVMLAGTTLYRLYWVFAADLTNVEVEMTVVDTATSLLKRYDNPLGQPFLPIQDTRAFNSCP